MIPTEATQSSRAWKVPAKTRAIFYLLILPTMELCLLLAIVTPWTAK